MGRHPRHGAYGVCVGGVEMGKGEGHVNQTKPTNQKQVPSDERELRARLQEAALGVRGMGCWVGVGMWGWDVGLGMDGVDE